MSNNMRGFLLLCKAKLQQQQRLLSKTLLLPSSSSSSTSRHLHQLSSKQRLGISRAAATTAAVSFLNDAQQQQQQQQQRWHGGGGGGGASISVTFLQADGVTRTPVQAFVGETLLETAHRNEIELEGACEGGMYTNTEHMSIATTTSNNKNADRLTDGLAG